ncbi:MAG TPA: hypothetical protein VFV87_20035, partial [Pirellulaceae bacterium]|nr:hypothetical protein [Pirellulaceae bacterium]
MARLQLSDSSGDAPGFVTAYLESMESADSICIEFCEPARRGDSVVRFVLTRAEAAGLIGRISTLLARGDGEPDSPSNT